MEMQNISVSGIDIKSEMGGKIRITVTDIYDGKDYDSFAISEPHALHERLRCSQGEHLRCRIWC